MPGTAEGAAKARAKREAGKQDQQPKGYYVGRRPVTFQGKVYAAGEPFPEAAALPRLESWIRTGAIVER